MQPRQELHVTDHPVGIQPRVEELISLLTLDCKEPLIVAVLGISGIGKTTYVKALFNRIAALFDASYFFADVNSYCGSANWKVQLQKELISCLSQDNAVLRHNDGVTMIRRLISHRKLLIVLDDVSNSTQWKALDIDPRCLQEGSRVIVTTIDRESLCSVSHLSHDTNFLNQRESLELFNWLTFEKNNHFDQTFVREVVALAHGFPLVLDVWSRHFGHHERKHWPSILETLKRIPHGDVHNQLKISYDSLSCRAKKLFLDIPCFFHGEDKGLVVKVLQDEDSKFYPDIVIKVPVDKGLVIRETESNGLSMHYAIWQMGEEIVRQENEDELGQRTRLRGERGVFHVLKERSGTESVESIILYTETKATVHVEEAFRNMSNLRLIKFECDGIHWTCSNDDMHPSCFEMFRYLEWNGFPFKYIDNDMSNVVIRLRNSILETLWKGDKILKKLTILDVSFSKSLIKTGNFYGLENLEELLFYGCPNLEEFDCSVGCLHKLAILDLRGCEQLKVFHFTISK